MLLKFLIFCVVWKQCNSVIYNLNVTEYNRMPALYHLDDYESCLSEGDGLYCVVDAVLFTERHSDLMHMIQAYSEHKLKHFNHTQIHRGVCVTKCKQFLTQSNNTVDLDKTLGACLNDSMWRDYELQARVFNVQYCRKRDEPINIDTLDIIVAVIYLVILVLNAVGSLYDIFVCQEDAKSGNIYLLAFSVRRNWRRLVAPSGGGSEPRLERLKLFHGLRTMTMMCVFFSHTVLIMSYSYVDNPLYIETSYLDPLKQILFNGSLVTHTFFVMSSFLLAYNYSIMLERRPASWWLLPRGIAMRWLRLTPTYAVVLAFICTWMRHLGSGPLWGLVVESEWRWCRVYWWAHLLYFNNYVYDDAFCAPQTWYLAADTQLFCLGLLVCVVARSPRCRNILLGCLFVVALLIVAGHTYFQDLDAVVLQSPERSYRELYAHDATFRVVYVRGHTNLSTYLLGLAGGFLTYHWQTEGKDITTLKKWVLLYWMVFPLGVLVILSGGLFYVDDGDVSTVLRVLYATLYKPIFQLLVVVLIVGTIFKIEGVYRRAVEWRGWHWTGRVSYCGFLLHTVFQRGLLAAHTQPTHLSDYYVLMVLSGTILLSFTCGAVLWLLVEAPAAALVKLATTTTTTTNTTTASRQQHNTQL